MKRITYEITRGAPDGPVWMDTVIGYEVPETEGLFGVDRRGPREWVPTHIPTGYALSSQPTRAAAIAYAQRVYRLGKRYRVPMTCRNGAWLAPRWRRVAERAGLIVRPVA